MGSENRKGYYKGVYLGANGCCPTDIDETEWDHASVDEKKILIDQRVGNKQSYSIFV